MKQKTSTLTRQQIVDALSPIEQQYRIPEPTWHGHSQIFYRLQDAPPWLLIDMALLKTSSPPHNRFLEPEVYQQIAQLFYCANLAHLEHNQEAAVALFGETLGELRDLGLSA